MGTCIAEIAGAVPEFMDMHSVKVTGAFRFYIGKPENLRFYQYAAVIGAVKFNETA